MSVKTLHATLGSGYQTSMTTRTFTFTADEPVDLGGTDTAPTPEELLMGSLAACTAITLRMYAQRKAWPVEGLDVQVDYTSTPSPSFVKHIAIRGDLDEAQKARLVEIADRCPVARLLTSGAAMESRLVAV
jgi:putative redox protein